MWDMASKDRPPGVPAVPGSKIDEHIDVDEVERVFARLFPTGTFAKLDAQHEILASGMPVVDTVLDTVKRALDAR